MIFLTEKIRNRNRIEVFVYDSLEDLAQRVDWQDILDESLRILDEDGNLYAWDDSKERKLEQYLTTHSREMELTFT